jgi:hypothetical protein
VKTNRGHNQSTQVDHAALRRRVEGAAAAVSRSLLRPDAAGRGRRSVYSLARDLFTNCYRREQQQKHTEGHTSNEPGSSKADEDYRKS